MKKQKVITIVTIILLIVIITAASVFGIYGRKEYRVSNKVPKYILGMEFTSARLVNLEAKSDESEEENKVNNYKQAKNIIENRLNNLGVEQYKIRETGNGNIQIELPSDDQEETDTVISILGERGVFQLTDNETNDVLLDNNYINDTKVVYSQSDTTGSTVFLQIKFNKEGTQKLEEISKIYVQKENQEENEAEESEDSTETKQVAIVFDGQTYRTTYFGDTITDGTLNIAIGQGTDSETINEYTKSAKQMQTIIDSGVLPEEYNVTQYTISSSLSNIDTTSLILIISGLILVVMFVYSIMKLKSKGIFAILLQIGYTALLLLTLRYTNIKITLEGIVGIIMSMILNYIYIYSAFKNIQDDFIKDITAKIGLKSMPVCIVAIVFTFNKIANISSIGMVLVWGLITMYIYNLILTQITVKTIRSK